MTRSVYASMFLSANKKKGGIEQMKKWYQSGTFWGALVTGLTGVGKIAVGVSTGDMTMVGTGLSIVAGCWTAWRMRKGQGVIIDGE